GGRPRRPPLPHGAPARGRRSALAGGIAAGDLRALAPPRALLARLVPTAQSRSLRSPALPSAPHARYPAGDRPPARAGDPGGGVKGWGPTAFPISKERSCVRDAASSCCACSPQL